MYRRRIILDAEETRARAGVEDDFHHFDVTLTHDGREVTAIGGTAYRTPWTTCPEAVIKLDQLIGLPLSTRAARFDAEIERHLHCTHLMELALFTIAQAARGGRRQYDISLPDVTPEAGRRQLELRRDGVLFMVWVLDGENILLPAQFAGHTVRNIGSWAATHCDDDGFEAVKAMRRCVLVAAGRSETRRLMTASELKSRVGACYAFQSERLKESLRTDDLPIDFTLTPSALLSEMK